MKGTIIPQWGFVNYSTIACFSGCLDCVVLLMLLLDRLRRRLQLVLLLLLLLLFLVICW